MRKNSPFFSGFAVDEVAEARGFYGQTLGVFELVELPGATVAASRKWPRGIDLSEA